MKERLHILALTYPCLICVDVLDDILGPRHSAEYTVPWLSWNYAVIGLVLG